MNKKNTGATLGVLVAVSIGATAYASAMTNLDKDTNTKSLLENKVSYVEPVYKAKLKTVKADYTKDLENTKIGESKKEVAVSKTEEIATLYDDSKEVSVSNEEHNDIKSKDNTEENLVKEENTDNVVEEEIASEDVEEAKEENLDNVSEGKDTDDVVEEEKIESEDVEEVKEENPEQKLMQASEDFEVKTFEANSSAELENEEEQVVNINAEKFVNVESLNVRKSASIDSDIVTTIKAGDKVTGNIEGDWLNTDKGYIKVSFLQDSYPQALVDEIKAKKAEAEKKAQEEAQRKAEAEKKAQEEAQRKAEAEKKAQEEAQKNKAVNYTGWVNTAGLNIRSNSSTNGSILGTLTKGDKVSGVLQNGWIKFNFNGREAFVKASFVVDYEVQKPAPAPAPVVEQKPQQQVNNNVQQAPVVTNGNGQSAANIAQQFAGYPYVFGASNPSVGFDCSGLVHYAYRQLGINLARNSAAQFSNGYAVNSNNLVPGDLVFFSYGGGIDHVGIITGYDGTFIHASTPGTGVVYGNIFSNHYQSVFRGARRIF